MILDSGDRTEYSSGAVRDIKEDKGRCDLMPLIQIGICLEDDILIAIGKYQHTRATKYLQEAITEFINDFMEGQDDALLELSMHFSEGAKKYNENNWQKGIPESSYIDSGVRHYLKFMRGDKDERHDRAFLWNMFCLWWTHDNITEDIK